MRKLIPGCFVPIAYALPGGGTTSQSNESVVADPGLRAFLSKFEEATSRFINGDATLWKQHVSQGDDVTIVGGWGAYEKGGEEVRARYDWAASRFRDSNAKLSVEYVASAVSGDLAYTVAIERSEVRIADVPDPARMALRVTHVFRREGGDWKLVHRHADPLMSKTPAPAVLQK